eukprot:jgi/Ulvmu1/9108/UM005_0203.1
MSRVNACNRLSSRKVLTWIHEHRAGRQYEQLSRLGCLELHHCGIESQDSVHEQRIGQLYQRANRQLLQPAWANRPRFATLPPQPQTGYTRLNTGPTQTARQQPLERHAENSQYSEFSTLLSGRCDCLLPTASGITVA